MSFDQSNVNNLIGTVEGFAKDHDEFMKKVREVNALRDMTEEYKRARVEAMADEFREAHAGTLQAITDAEKAYQADVDAYSNGVDLDSDYMATLSRTVGTFGAKMPTEVVQSLVSKATRPWEARLAAAAFENAGIKSGPGLANARAQALTPPQAGSFAARAYIAIKNPVRDGFYSDFYAWRNNVQNTADIMQWGPGGNPNADVGQGGDSGADAE
ncbi:hypothetical protein HF885_01285 [Olsenella umbonata]|uniref:Uncharacterized protein n=1 Tax=Parafannyhessea umbonata TaxID=604330 RepID=A0A7X9XZJ5_9ACTN|nr:hypothetical protein [Parafannyhessea umbonata]NMF25078.1 hypothetical protein [Parafannyhessea umbonata]